MPSATARDFQRVARLSVSYSFAKRAVTRDGITLTAALLLSRCMEAVKLVYPLLYKILRQLGIFFDEFETLR